MAVLKRRLAVAGAALAVDDVGAASISAIIGQQLRRVLQIGVDHQDALAAAWVRPAVSAI